MIKVGIVGATGYAGQQLVWLLNIHKFVKIDFVSSNSYSGKEFEDVYPSYRNKLNLPLISIDEVSDKIKNIDVLFLALPHGKSANLVKLAVENSVKVIDLGADFRLKSTKEFQYWYNTEFKYPEFIDKSVYGLPELKFKEKIKNSEIIANPGCYPTSALLALAPLLKNKLIDVSSIIIDSKSGVSGAGRSLKLDTLYTECNESIKAYGVGTHRHTAEIEQELSILCGEKIKVVFTPHLVPMNRGILSVMYSNYNEDISVEDLYELYKVFYKDSYFVRIIEGLPETRFVKGTNFCDISIRVDNRTKKIIIISAIDNLIKGAAGQAIQNMNILFELNEFEGLENLAMNP